MYSTFTGIKAALLDFIQSPIFLVFACQEPSFVCQEKSWNRARVCCGMYSFSPALSLSHLFQSVSSLPVLHDEDEQLSGKARGLSFDEQIRVSYKYRRSIDVRGCWYRPLPFPVESLSVFLPRMRRGRWFHPWQRSALPVTGARTVLHMSTSKWPQGVPREMCPRASATGNFSIGMVRAWPLCLQPARAGGESSCLGSAALGPGWSCLPLSPDPPRGAAAGRGRGWRDLCPSASCQVSFVHL